MTEHRIFEVQNPTINKVMNPEDDCMQHDVLAAAHHQMMPEMA